MAKFGYLARADAIMAEKDVSRKAAERFWHFQDEIEDPKNAWWNMNDIMRKLDGFRPRAPSEWLTQAIYDRLVEQVSDYSSCARQVPPRPGVQESRSPGAPCRSRQAIQQCEVFGEPVPAHAAWLL